MKKNAITYISEILSYSLYIQRDKLPNSWDEKILGVILDNELKFEPHIKNICNKVAQKDMQPQKFPRNEGAK